MPAFFSPDIAGVCGAQQPRKRPKKTLYHSQLLPVPIAGYRQELRMVQGPRLPLGSQYKGLPSSVRENRTRTMRLLRTLPPEVTTH